MCIWSPESQVTTDKERLENLIKQTTHTDPCSLFNYLSIINYNLVVKIPGVGATYYIRNIQGVPQESSATIGRCEDLPPHGDIIIY